MVVDGSLQMSLSLLPVAADAATTRATVARRIDHGGTVVRRRIAYISYFYLYKYFYIEQGWAVT